MEYKKFTKDIAGLDSTPVSIIAIYLDSGFGIYYFITRLIKVYRHAILYVFIYLFIYLLYL